MIPLTDDELRGLVREAIGRVRSQAAGAPAPPREPTTRIAAPPGHLAAATVHASQLLFVLGPGGDADGHCVIEPAVRCNHCGYCQSYGH